ncbi:MAG TPA: type IX secretion system sortase PorU [Bacteroidales bacterium]|nr:type IX secretion system sortase PorU [Bacteroidales bacterium]HOX73595.1 type IX secretion system sortase PorU [Bacteroidales bacterium]HPM87805.1 type IX secretion system sortase PorU [Bacteroidales bacterium]HQM69950.1 type IX secretion system sortase PorU [Bacteroidales bacterium]
MLHKISLIFIFIPGILLCQPAKDSYSSSSVLSAGQWFKVAVLKDGIYRIDYSRLRQAGANNPALPRIFANNSGQLSYYTSDPSPDDLTEVSVLLVTGQDGIFNEGDYLLFFGQGTGRWKFNINSGEYDFMRHNYSDTAYYFITSGTVPSKRITDAVIPSGPPDYQSSGSDVLYIHEVESENIIKSGREWYQPVSPIADIQINPGFTDLIPGEPVKYRVRMLARAPSVSDFHFSESSTLLKTIRVQDVNMYNYTGTYAQITDSAGSSVPLSSSPVYMTGFKDKTDAGVKGWLDYVKLHARKRSSYSGNTAFIADYRSAGPGRITGFTIKSPGEDPLVWDVTDPMNPENINYTRNGEDIIFTARTDSLRNYVVFSLSNAIQPLFRSGTVPNQDLHGSPPAEMVIVTHPLFLKYAEQLASLHLMNSGLISQIVTPGQIYNEFSGGIPDVAAIRNFLRMKYFKQKGTETTLKYLLLFGDGSFENKTLPPSNPNFIPTWQSQNSNIIVSSFTSDDFYGLLEDGEGEAEGTEDLGIGRLPVSDTAQAGTIVRKIASYMAPANTGEWKNTICILADDEDGNAHMADAEGLSLLLRDSVPEYNIDKIYLDAFRQETSVNGQTYPDVTIAVNNRINSGCLIFNYVGHGNENGLAHERVVKTEDINTWKNGTRLPLFITATCEFSRFDDIDMNIVTRTMTSRTSAGEMVLLNENGGGIALMSTTRVVYSAPNYYLNRNIYDATFDTDESGNPRSFGDIIRIAKNNSGNGPNKRNFSLLGDPAVRLAWPWHGRVVTDSVNHVSVNAKTDSLKALSTVTISGHIEDRNGTIMNNFNGTILPVVFDKASSVKTLANDGGLSMTFDLTNNILFSGKTSAANGKFRFTFIVPRDIDYSFGQGRISYYASSADKDMTGYYTEIVVGGFASVTGTDKKGPEIKLFMNDTLFRNGGITDANPRILALIKDEGGINTTGAGIGHDLIAYIDNDPKSSVILNNYFINDQNSYISGKVAYDLSDIPQGDHTLTLKAWDNFNNSSQQTIKFIVEPEGEFILKDLISYPNPVVSETRISAGHNRPDEEIEIILTILDMSGRVIRVIKEETFTTGYQLPPLTWDGRTDGGRRAGKGIYIYSLRVSTRDGEEAKGTGRIIIL